MNKYINLDDIKNRVVLLRLNKNESEFVRSLIEAAYYLGGRNQILELISQNKVDDLSIKKTA